jgi:nucleoside-diphosphate-sugar epimerase
VYGPNVQLPAREDSPCDPRGFYSITKRAAEQLVISFCETFDMKYRILRLGNVLGATDTKVSAKKNALQFLFNEMKAGKNIEIYEGGNFYRSYIYIEDCIDAIHTVVEKGNLNEIYNIGTTERMKFIDMLHYAGDLIGYQGEYRFVPQKEFHKKVQAKSFYLDVDKLYGLGFQHRYDPEHMIAAVLDQ